MPANSGVAGVGDINADGFPDIVVPSRDGFDWRLNIYLGTGDGGVAPAPSLITPGAPTSVDLGDLNRDGHIDLIWCELRSNAIRVALGHSDGSFAILPEAYDTIDSWEVRLADVDQDGKLDVLSGNSVVDA